MDLKDLYVLIRWEWGGCRGNSMYRCFGYGEIKMLRRVVNILCVRYCFKYVICMILFYYDIVSFVRVVFLLDSFLRFYSWNV